MPHKTNRVQQTCQHCRKPFLASHYSVVRGRGRYCSHRCFRVHSYGETLADRFWMHVAVTEVCWLWSGPTANGYGMMRDQGKHIYAHRFSWELHREVIPNGLQVHHDCPTGDNPLCVNPDHLWLGTQDQNVRDCLGKGRMVSGWRLRAQAGAGRGEKHPGAKLNEAAVIAIRARHAVGDVTCNALAVEYGVSFSLIGQIVKRRIWTHLP